MDGYRLFRKDSDGEELPFEARAAGMHEFSLRTDEKPAESQVTADQHGHCGSCLLQTTSSEKEARGVFTTVQKILGLLFHKN